MDAAQALADLTEISAQIEAAVLAGMDGSVVASTFQQEGRGEELARAAVELVAAAGEARGDPGAPELVQIQAATPRGSLFVVRDGGHVVAALTDSKPTVGLVFYDLKTCLRMLEREAEKPEKSAKADKPEKPEKPEKPTATTEKVGKASSPRKQTTTRKKEEVGGDEST
jgi:predicted regulator of Ras-like GTPase activity (Roadblock/LC7/MglB family)